MRSDPDAGTLGSRRRTHRAGTLPVEGEYPCYASYIRIRYV